MNSDSLVDLLQQSFRVTLGATASLVEVLQDPQKREENLTKLQVELSQYTQDWAVRGEMTEQEARRFVDGLMSQGRSPSYGETTPPPSTSETVSTTPPPVAEPNTQIELQELTAQIAAIRTELEKLRDQDSAP